MKASWRFLGLAASLACAVFAPSACFRSPDMGKLSCTTSERCPGGYECVVPTGMVTGTCRGVGDAATLDAQVPPDGLTGVDAAPRADLPRTDDAAIPSDSRPPGVDGTGKADAVPTVDAAQPGDAEPDAPLTQDDGADLAPRLDAPGSVPDLAPDLASDLLADLSPPPPDLGPDLPPKKALGAPCTLGSECADGFCSAGVCCDRACAGTCEECTAVTGGRCQLKSGMVCNPASDCLDAAICSGTSATCPARQPKSAGTACGTVTCAGNVQSASTCDGAGNCGTRTSTDCWPFKCQGGAGCKTSCAASTDCVQEGAVFCGANGQCRTDPGCWRDLTTNLLWQVDPEAKYYQLADAKSLCTNLSLCGFDDWSLPDIDQLRSLIRGCANTQTGGACGITTSCLTDACEAACVPCEEMMGPYSGCYTDPGVGGPCSLYWSTSTYHSESRDTTRARFVGFTGAVIGAADTTDGGYVRCVRR